MLLFTLAAFAQDAPEPPPAAASPVTYALDGDRSWLGVLVRYDRSALVAGHDHVVTPSSFTGEVTWNPEDVGSCKIAIRFPVDALQVDPPGSRARLSLEGETSDGDKKSIKKNLAGKHQLQASVFPDITFTSTSCTPKGDKVAVTGTLTMHGVGATVTADMAVDATAEGFRAKGGFKATHGTWGMDPFTALLGSLRNDDGLTFSIDVAGKPR